MEEERITAMERIFVSVADFLTIRMLQTTEKYEFNIC